MESSYDRFGILARRKDLLKDGSLFRIKSTIDVTRLQVPCYNEKNPVAFGWGDLSDETLQTSVAICQVYLTEFGVYRMAYAFAATYLHEITDDEWFLSDEMLLGIYASLADEINHGDDLMTLFKTRK